MENKPASFTVCHPPCPYGSLEIGEEGRPYEQHTYVVLVLWS